jgi:hypothetical protein
MLPMERSSCDLGRRDRRMRVCCLIVIALCAFLTGCDEAGLMKKLTPQEDESVSRHYIELLRQGKFDQIKRDLDPSLVDSNVQTTIANMAAIFPAEIPETVKVVGVHTSRDRESSTVNITFEYQFPSKWLLVNVATQKTGDVRTIVGFHVTAIANSLENLNQFTVVGKGVIQYLTLTVAVGCLLFTFYVLILCVRSKNVERRWLWMIFVLIGVGKFAVNWTTGQYTFQLLTIHIPCFSATRPFYGPWTVETYLPLGALLFFNRWSKMNITPESTPVSVIAPD